MADDILTKKRITEYEETATMSTLRSDDVMYVDGQTLGTRKIAPLPILNNLFKSSGVSVTDSNYSTTITDVNSQPVNTIYTYAANLQSKISNLPSNFGVTILHYTPIFQASTAPGQVMLAIERTGDDKSLYFRTTSGSPAAWSSWQKVTNGSDVEAAITEALNNFNIETDNTLTQEGKPADAKAVGDEISDLKADLSERYDSVKLSYGGIQTFAGFGNFQSYGLNADGSFKTNQRYRVSNNDPMTFNDSITVSVKSGFKWGYIPFVDGQAGSFSGWKTADYTVPSGTSFVAQIARVSEVTSEIADVGEFLNALTFPTKIGLDVKNANDKINAVSDVVYSDVNLSQVTWQIGTIRSSDGVNYTNNNAIRTQGYISIEGSIQLAMSMPDGYLFGAHLYDADHGHLWSSSAWNSGNATVDVVENAVYLRVNITKAVSEAGNVEWGEELTISALHDISKDISDINNKVDSSIGIKIDVVSNAKWEIGSIGNDGANVYRNNVIRTQSYIDIFGLDEIKATPTGSVIQYGLHAYDENFKNVFNDSAYQTNEKTYTVGSNWRYIRCNVAARDASLLPDSDFSWLTYLTINASGATSDVYGMFFNGIGGKRKYTGKRINFGMPEPELHDYTIETFREYTSDNTPNLASYNLKYNQSLAIYGNYIFLLLNGGSIVVASLENGDIIGIFSTDVMTNNHNNSAQFSDIFYDSADDFPLLFVSRCGNTTGENPGLDTCLIYRVQMSNNAFTFTLVNTISTDITTYGADWAIDSKSRELTLVCYLNGTYSVTDNNPVAFITWKLPSANEIVSGTEIVLNYNNRIGYYQIDFMLLQSAIIYNGKAFVCSGSNGQYVYVVDTHNKILCNILQSGDNREIEGIAIINNTIYVTHRTTSGNPLIILKLIV